MQQELVTHIWAEKYRYVPGGKEGAEVDEARKDLQADASIADTHRRVVEAVYIDDPSVEHRAKAYEIHSEMDFLAGGRIIAGAGTGRQVTLLNCYVNGDTEDSMRGIMASAANVALTMKQGGGIGTPFSDLRPKGALVRGVDSESTGAVSFMKIHDSICLTIKSAGARRGAMMATMRVDHPDVIDFIHAKQEAGVLTQFNVSVLVTDDFMSAVEAGEDWDLGFRVPRADGNHVEVYEKNGAPWYVYQRLPARDLMNMIIRATYEYAEPGVIFVDRVNAHNNLRYIEDIQCSNPCGEQMLPAHGACNLGAVNFANFVVDPFTEKARFDFDRMASVVHEAVRFLDNVLDVSGYPLPEQRKEALAKRRIGLGFMGFGNMLQKMRLRYGGEGAMALTREIAQKFMEATYSASVDLAEERGPFPTFDAAEFCKSHNVKKLSKELQARIRKVGIRNGVLNTVAPTGTTAIFAGNVSSGIEPAFAHRMGRSVLQNDGSKREYTAFDDGFLSYCATFDLDPETVDLSTLPEYMDTALKLDVSDHLRMQGLWQEYIDASISKTINCPADMDYESFKNVYLEAYRLGCKGCTTYRPSAVRGAVLTVEEDKKEEPAAAAVVTDVKPFKRPQVLDARVYKGGWTTGNLFITISDTEVEGPDGEKFRTPVEVFVKPGSPADMEFADAMSITLTALLRQTMMLQSIYGKKHFNLDFLIEHLKMTKSVEQGYFDQGRYIASKGAVIGDKLEQHLQYLKEQAGVPVETVVEKVLEMASEDGEALNEGIVGEMCPKCGSPSMIPLSGCLTCQNCSHSKCGA